MRAVQPKLVFALAIGASPEVVASPFLHRDRAPPTRSLHDVARFGKTATGFPVWALSVVRAADSLASARRR